MGAERGDMLRLIQVEHEIGTRLIARRAIGVRDQERVALQRAFRDMERRWASAQRV